MFKRRRRTKTFTFMRVRRHHLVTEGESNRRILSILDLLDPMKINSFHKTTNSICQREFIRFFNGTSNSFRVSYEYCLMFHYIEPLSPHGLSSTRIWIWINDYSTHLPYILTSHDNLNLFAFIVFFLLGITMFLYLDSYNKFDCLYRCIFFLILFF